MDEFENKQQNEEVIPEVEPTPEQPAEQIFTPAAEPQNEPMAEPAPETVSEPVNEPVAETFKAPEQPFAAEAQPQEKAAEPVQSYPFYENTGARQNTEPLKPFEYSPVNRDKNGENNSKGIKIFALVMAAIIVVTGACSAGYFFGRRSIIKSSSANSKVELAQKPANTAEMTAAQVYEKVNKSIVGIRVYNSSGAFADASGVVYGNDGYIVTNDHIYSQFGAPKFKVYTYDGKEHTAVYVAGDKVCDLAILKVEGLGAEQAEFGDSTKLFCGEHVVAVGRPSSAVEGSSITSGVISLPERRVKNESNYAVNYIQTDSAINPGSSGGALVNMYGQVIGITTSKLAGDEYDAIGFAMPSAMMKRVVDDMIQNGKVTKRAKLGITYTEITSIYVEVGNYSSVGLLVASVSNDSDLYGKLKEGDTITHVNGIEINNDDVVLDIIEDSVAGDYITITVLSDGVTKELKAKLMTNEGESSYNPIETKTEEKAQEPDSGNEQGDMPNGGTFDFPFN